MHFIAVVIGEESTNAVDMCKVSVIVCDSTSSNEQNKCNCHARKTTHQLQLGYFGSEANLAGGIENPH